MLQIFRLNRISKNSIPRIYLLLLLVSCNGGSGSGTSTTSVPLAPSSLSLFIPSSSPGIDTTPTISVSGVSTGHTVKIFSDSSCSTEVGSAMAAGTSINVTISSPLTANSYNFYANSSNSAGSSGCSSATVAYTLVNCPSNFIPVPHNSNVGTQSDFCVMKYEAKNDGSGNAVSQPAGNPYVNISSADAKTKCTNLGANYDLISNQEWMTVARNAESVATNFSSGVMARGWSATFSGDGWANTGVAPSTGASCLYNTGANTCSSSGLNLYKRTLVLNNGEEIWDLSGNVWERIDWSNTTSGLQLGPTSCDPSIVDFPDVFVDPCFTNGDLLEEDVFPVTTNGSSSEGFGQFTGGTGGAAIRGGNWFNGTEAGAFSLNLGGNTTYTSGSVGFRCVYRL